MDVNSIRKARIYHILVFFLLFLLIVIMRLFYLQVDQEAKFFQLGEKNFLRMEVIPPLRGNLFDCNNVLLAANRPIYDLCWQGSGSNALTDNQMALLTRIDSFLDTDFTTSSKLYSLKNTEKYNRRRLLKDNLSFEQLCRISEQCSNTNHLVIENRFDRIYPFKTLASHILGYLSRVEKTGCEGVEKFFQNELSGKTGYVMSVFNSTGQKLSEKEYKDATAGTDIQLTLDVTMQALAEHSFEEGQSGAFILMDSESGALRALVSYPEFDPNLFLSRISEADWQEKLAVNNPLLNRVTTALYPPASIFKLVTIAAGLEEGIVRSHDEFYCPGFVKFCGRKYACQRKWGHGLLPLREGLAVSCNVPCFEIAKKLQIDTLASYAFRFGLGSKAHFILPEKSGLIPTSVWKKTTKGEPWWAGETLSATIGQSYLLVTPLQIARMVSSICTGQLVKPRILVQEAIEKEPLDISERTLEFLRDSMNLAVQNGTVSTLKHLTEFSLRAKTGTAQTCDLKLEKTSRSHYEHAWVAGFFRYKNERPLTMIVLLEHVGASRPAVLLADRFLMGYKALRENRITLDDLRKP